MNILTPFIITCYCINTSIMQDSNDNKYYIRVRVPCVSAMCEYQTRFINNFTLYNFSA